MNLKRTDGAVDQTYLGTTDHIYNGDRTKWLKLAYGLQAISLNHFSNKGTYQPAAIIAAVDKSFASEADDFVVCTDREALRQLAETWRYARHVGGSAATVVLVAPLPADQDTRDWVFYDMGQATLQMMLAAADLGIGSSHAALDDQALARQVLGIPEDRFCVGLVAFGYPADRPLRPIERPDRRPVDQVIHRERW